VTPRRSPLWGGRGPGRSSRSYHTRKLPSRWARVPFAASPSSQWPGAKTASRLAYPPGPQPLSGPVPLGGSRWIQDAQDVQGPAWVPGTALLVAACAVACRFEFHLCASAVLHQRSVTGPGPGRRRQGESDEEAGFCDSDRPLNQTAAVGAFSCSALG
jgi:hypothetical protein